MKETNIFGEDSININMNLKVELSFLDLKIDLSLNDNYFSFISNICKIIKISKEDIDFIVLSYIDDDGDTILLSSKDDYDILYAQVKENLVNKLILNIKENSKLNANECYSNFLNYSEKINLDKNNIINYKEKEEKINKIEIRKNDDDIDNNIINQDDNNNKNFNLIDNYFNYDKDNIIFEFECSSCNEYPIYKILFYCPICDLYLCSKCERNTSNHIHPILKIETYEELMNILYDNFEIIEDNNENPEQEKKENKFDKYIPEFIKNFSKGRIKKILKKERKIKYQ